MIQKITNAQDAMDALSENYEQLIMMKRKPDFAREVANNIGKMIGLAKTQVIEKMRTGDKTPVQWLADDNVKQLK